MTTNAGNLPNRSETVELPGRGVNQLNTVGGNWPRPNADEMRD